LSSLANKWIDSTKEILPFLAYAFAEVAKFARLKLLLFLKGMFDTKILPVWVFNPAFYEILITLIVNLFKKNAADHFYEWVH